MLGHIIEAERRGFAGRIRIILAAGDPPSLQRWDQNAVARERKDCERDIEALVGELSGMREDSAALAASLRASRPDAPRPASRRGRAHGVRSDSGVGVPRPQSPAADPRERAGVRVAAHGQRAEVHHGVIRAAERDDAPAIARVQIDTWRAAYRGIVWDATLDGLSPAHSARHRGELLAEGSGARFILVADDATDGVTGFAAAGPERSGDATYRGELYAIYVLPSAQGRGLGAGLVRGVANRLAAAGTTAMLLWVFEANTPARTFYERLGGIFVSTQPIDIAGQTLTEVAYGWPDLRALAEAR